MSSVMGNGLPPQPQQQGTQSPAQGTPVMNSILEEDSPSSGDQEFSTPFVRGNNEEFSLSSTRPFFASPAMGRPNSSAMYSNTDGNNSSSSLIYNPSFTFGGSNAPPVSESRRQSLKYVPGPQLAPPTTRTKSPVRSASPDARDTRKKNLEAPFTFSSMSAGSGSRTSFRKGHRYKHSSVSMNFFQEPEVKIPLNIAKSLPIPDWNDLVKNLAWPRAHFQLAITCLQLITCILVFQLGHNKSWTNFITLSHFMTYDIVGSLIIIFVENVSQFEVWATGTITFPFGLNRVDVVSSFASAVSLCFVGLDLIFHMLEEFIVLFVEYDDENHDEINSQIPHSHHSEGGFELAGDDFKIWYCILFANLALSSLSLFKVFYANKNSKLKTKNPLITISYTVYLAIYPYLFDYLHFVSDYVATCMIATFILIHGFTIAEWTSTILLLGFSTTTIPASSLLHNPTATEDSNVESAKAPSTTGSIVRRSQQPTILKSQLRETIEMLPEFKAKCDLKHEDLIIAKVNFSLYIILIKMTLKGGSNEDELNLRLAIDKCIKNMLPCSETTIEVDRV